MKKIYLLALVSLLITGGCKPSEVALIQVSRFGLQPNTRENAIPAVMHALDECKKHKKSVLLFDKGRYDFYVTEGHTRKYFESNTTNDAPKNLAILIERCKALTLN